MRSLNAFVLLFIVLLGPSVAWSEPYFAGIWSKKEPGGVGGIFYDLSWDGLFARKNELSQKGQYLSSVEVYRKGGQWRYAGLWRIGSGNGALYLQPWNDFVNTWKRLKKTQDLIDIEILPSNSGLKYLGVWRHKQGRNRGDGGLFIGMTWDDLVAKWRKLGANSYLADVESYVSGGKRLFVGVWRVGRGNGSLYLMTDWKAFAKLKKDNNASQQMLDFEMFQSKTGQWKFLGVWRKSNDAGPLYASSSNARFNPLTSAELMNHWKRLRQSRTMVGLTVAVKPVRRNPERRSSSVYKIDYLGNHPSNRNSGWSEDLQGVANDSQNWYFTKIHKIWKFPLTHDLSTKIEKTDRARGIFGSFSLGDNNTPAELKGYDHFGDPDVHQGKLYVPVENTDSDWVPRIAVFDAKTLTFIDSYPLKVGDDRFKQNRAGWCAIDPVTGYLYTSNSKIDKNNPLFVYKIRFDASRGFILDYVRSVVLREDVNTLQRIKGYMQGGDFSTDGSTLYLLNGRTYSPKKGKFDSKDGGIWVFDVKSGRRIMKSTTGGNFRYEFHPGASKLQEPEGITVWDLDGKNAPRILGGQVHAILLNVNWKRDDKFWLKHYRVHTRD